LPRLPGLIGRARECRVYGKATRKAAKARRHARRRVPPAGEPRAERRRQEGVSAFMARVMSQTVVMPATIGRGRACATSTACRNGHPRDCGKARIEGRRAADKDRLLLRDLRLRNGGQASRRKICFFFFFLRGGVRYDMLCTYSLVESLADGVENYVPRAPKRSPLAIRPHGLECGIRCATKGDEIVGNYRRARRFQGGLRRV